MKALLAIFCLVTLISANAQTTSTEMIQKYFKSTELKELIPLKKSQVKNFDFFVFDISRGELFSIPGSIGGDLFLNPDETFYASAGSHYFDDVRDSRNTRIFYQASVGLGTVLHRGVQLEFGFIKDTHTNREDIAAMFERPDGVYILVRKK